MKVTISLCEMITFFTMLINYGKCENIASQYFYINKLNIIFSCFTHPKTPSKIGTLYEYKRETKTIQVELKSIKEIKTWTLCGRKRGGKTM